MSDGGQAFPGERIEHGEWRDGMSLRDYFAARLMPIAFDMQFGEHGSETDFGACARLAYRMADSMLEAREAAEEL